LIEDFFYEEACTEAVPVRAALAEWAAEATDQLRRARPKRLGVRDRLEEALRLPLAIADTAGEPCDLLYAVVTGQRNNEDSRRKALAAQAGRKRALARGEFIGHLPDGYRIVVDVDERNQVTKRMVRDPERQRLIELIFRLSLRGRRSGQIAASVNNAGWLTKPIARGSSPRRSTSKGSTKSSRTRATRRSPPGKAR
jgi:hypothetical protein